MIAKIALLLAAVAAAQATVIAPGLLNTGLLSPGLLNAGLLSPGHLNAGLLSPGHLNAGLLSPGHLNAGLLSPGWLRAGLVGPAAVRTGSVVAIPGAVSTDSRIIAGAPLLANGVLTNGIIGASPLVLGKGLVAPIGLRTSLLTAPGVVKTII